jgi:hypothetical protein
MRTSLKVALWFAVGALVLNVVAYILVLLSPYPYPIFTRIVCYLAYWPAILAQSSGASPNESGVLILDIVAWAAIGFISDRLLHVYRHGSPSV